MAARNPENVVNFAPGPAKIPAEVKWSDNGSICLILTLTFLGAQEGARWDTQH